MKRFFAWAGILIIAAVFLALIVLTFTGGPENVILAPVLRHRHPGDALRLRADLKVRPKQKQKG